MTLAVNVALNPKTNRHFKYDECRMDNITICRCMARLEPNIDEIKAIWYFVSSLSTSDIFVLQHTRNIFFFFFLLARCLHFHHVSFYTLSIFFKVIYRKLFQVIKGKLSNFRVFQTERVCRRQV